MAVIWVSLKLLRCKSDHEGNHVALQQNTTALVNKGCVGMDLWGNLGHRPPPPDGGEPYAIPKPPQKMPLKNPVAQPREKDYSEI
jgi:hypothetical protein